MDPNMILHEKVRLRFGIDISQKNLNWVTMKSEVTD